MRLGVCLVVVSLVLGLVSPPKAEAFALTTTAGVVALVGGFLAACGLPFLVKGMNESGLTESVGRLLQEYLTAELGGQTVLEWVGDAALAVVGGRIMIPGLLAGKLTAFAQWVQEQYGAQVGENVVYQHQGFTAANGVYYELGHYISGEFSVMGTNILDSLVIGDTWSISLTDSVSLFFENISSSEVWDSVRVHKNDLFLGQFDLNQKRAGWHYTEACFVMYEGNLAFMIYSSDPIGHYLSSRYRIQISFSIDDLLLDFSDLSVDRAESITIPGELAEGQDLALDVGAVEGMEIQEILQGILDAILAGDLAASAEAVEAQPEQPPEEDIKDIDGLGLPALGAALITRFPFSIPWDIAKGIQLLAAPAKAPYFEVDFFAPIADRVGGWQGSTKIVLDFSQFEILGQLSRWTSTVGFCLMLAGATKRFIWTA